MKYRLDLHDDLWVNSRIMYDNCHMRQLIRRQGLEGCHEFQVYLGHIVRPHQREREREELKNLHSLIASAVTGVMTLGSACPWLSKSYKPEQVRGDVKPHASGLQIYWSSLGHYF